MPKRFLMCPPTYFDIEYEINAWMSQDNPVDPPKAMTQWQNIKDVYEKLGHEVVTIEPAKGLPDMIFTGNAGQVIDGRALVATFKFPQRQPETALFKVWFEQNGYQDVTVPQHIWEGEADSLLVGQTIFASVGSRTEKAAHAELFDFFDLIVTPLTLVDPRFYHLDTCFCPLDDHTVMYYPDAFDTASQIRIKTSGLSLIEADQTDAAAFGLNAVSDGHHVVMTNQAKKLPAKLRQLGYEPILVDISEFKKSGGGVKCITLELRP